MCDEYTSDNRRYEFPFEEMDQLDGSYDREPRIHLGWD